MSITNKEKEIEMQYLRLDMYLNEREYLIGEADATEAGFEEILNLTDIIDGRIADQIRETGAAYFDDEHLTEELLTLLYEFTDKNVKLGDKIVFCMCLWERDEETWESEHLFSTYTLAQVQEA